jgi:ribonucleotide reductase alpha subunit
MRIKKRDGSLQNLSFNKIIYRLKKLCNDKALGKLHKIDPDIVAQKVVSSLYSEITSTEIDEEAARIAISITENKDFGKLASRIIISNLHKNTIECFSEVMEMLNAKHEIIKPEIIKIIKENRDTLDLEIDYKRDYLFDYFGYKTLEKGYLMKIYNEEERKMVLVERPQHLYMRVALAIHLNDIPNVLKTYNLLSEHFFTFASPTMFNGGTKAGNLSSCFLQSIEKDSLEGIFKAYTDSAKISKIGGGIGVDISNIRAKGSLIRGTNGQSDGIVPMLKVYNEISTFINQSGRRKGSFAIYLAPWHADILEYLDLRKPQGSENMRARDLFYAMWISDEFMKAVKEDSDWYLMCPNECQGLSSTYGKEFATLYWGYVEKGQYKKKIKAHKIWTKILEAQIETGTPYLTYKDSINNKSNQKNIGVIKNSNLCVAPETQILTSKGYFPIKDLENQIVQVWNGQEFTETMVCKTGENQELLKVVLNNGIEIECTPYHKFYITTNDIPFDAKDLKNGMRLIQSNFPIIENESNKILENTNVPINYSLETKIEWFEKYCDENPCVSKCNNIIQITNINQSLLKDIRYMLQTLGCDPKINKQSCTLLFNTDTLSKLGFRPNILNTSNINFNMDDVLVEEIIKTDRISDTYCFTETKRGMGIFNGVLTGQCAEITLVANEKETAVCNLASIPLPKYVEYHKGKPVFNFDKLHEITQFIIHGLNNVIDNNVYPTPEAEYSNKKNRPVGLGIQGLADCYTKMRLPFDSEEAKTLNKEIFETIYHGALTGSLELAKIHGPYETFKGSPFSQGKFQFDLAKEFDDASIELSGKWDWELLRKDVMEHGVRNSMLTALMPTASSAQIMNNCESFDPINSNIFKRRVLSGEYVIVNKYLVDDLTELKLWDKEMKDLIIQNDGSIANIDSIPANIKALYKTCWEISMKNVIEQSSMRQNFIDQTQSLNLFVKEPTFSKLTSMHFYAWDKKLKTGCYYLRSSAKSSSMKVIDQKKETLLVISNESDESDCIACSS